MMLGTLAQEQDAPKHLLSDPLRATPATSTANMHSSRVVRASLASNTAGLGLLLLLVPQLLRLLATAVARLPAALFACMLQS
jgi:hypothetical protein